MTWQDVDYVVVTSDSVDPDTGACFYEGDRFAAMSGYSPEYGCEVKVAGGYHWIPGSACRPA